MSEAYTLAELAGAVGRALDALGVHARNGRVRARPDARTVRYYTQLGLVDRPLPTGGRTAWYGRRHLLQVLAVKRLQQEGVALAEIQRRLTGASDPELFAAAGAGASDALTDAVAHSDGVDGADAAARAGPAFWRARPPAHPPDNDSGARSVLVVSLGEGVSLVLDGVDADDIDITEVRAAARPLLDQLAGYTAHEEER